MFSCSSRNSQLKRSNFFYSVHPQRSIRRHQIGAAVNTLMDGALIDLLGEDDAGAFQQELRGPLGWQR